VRQKCPRWFANGLVGLPGRNTYMKLRIDKASRVATEKQ